MASFLISLAVLVIGYFTYGKIVDRIFDSQPERETPAIAMEDGVDYISMDWKKAFLIQFLNIAGLGPIFGAIAGALWGPSAFLWIVFGTIFAGGVHDYLSGMLSIRSDGASISEIIGENLGGTIRQIMRVFSIVLLVLVGTVFMTGPAMLLANLTPSFMGVNIWLVIILAYYFIATFLPVDQIIGKLYPIFGLALLIMAFGVGGGLIFGDYNIPNIALNNLHPGELPMWPLLFVTIACGAISGFHSTQSPIMARCTNNEKEIRRIFYGAMVAEGIVALIWAAAAMTFFKGTGGLNEALTTLGGPAGVVHEITGTMMGVVGGVLAMLGVIAAPITSGDTAFRSVRLTLSDIFDIEQKSIKNRLMLAIPIFIVGGILSQMNFDALWRYFAWANQTVAMVVLWAGSMWLAKRGKNHWIAAIPAFFMTGVSVTYILYAPEGFSLAYNFSVITGIIIAIITMGIYLKKINSTSFKEIIPAEEKQAV
ncbi:carbon starvation CstA family protein [Halanaerobium praevalens]|uniref:Carbon starvation protein CstA n=1 Tax=Halanaerobium praevalens (strain ATCC 33744 / DSM 2228 / GSL) TaxID=572479 RepID=E3DME9_HALPG|nr:carbon starvation protein A [Halanaerobium praevalens]ADO76342.1 carbon starvation protein CstA [Halanaerobium praevalens DSM 2228]